MLGIVVPESRRPRPLCVWFVRHAQALPAAGDADPGLTPLGLRQAEKLAARLAVERFDLVYTSTMLRAMETARLVLKNREATPLERTDDLREVSRQHFLPDDDASDADRERVEAERDALQRFVNRVLHRHAAGQQLLMVCHGNVIRTLMPLFGGLNPEESILIQLHHASVSILDVMIYGEAVLRLANSVDHLAPDEVTEDNTIEGLNLSDVG